VVVLICGEKSEILKYVLIGVGITTYLFCMKVNETLKRNTIDMIKEPKAAEPRWYLKIE